LAKDPNQTDFLPQRKIVPSTPTKLGVLLDVERDFTIKFTYHPTEFSTDTWSKGIVSFNIPGIGVDYDRRYGCQPCILINQKRIYSWFYKNYDSFLVDGIMVLDQDNEIRVSFINGRYQLHVNGILGINKYPVTGIPTTDTLDVYTQVKMGNNISPYPARGYIQNIQYVRGG